MKKILQHLHTGTVLSAVFMTIGLVAFAAGLLFYTQSAKTEFTKKTVFLSEMSLSAASAEVGPGDSVAFAPTVHNGGTESMFAFLKITMPTAEGNNLYSFTADASWLEVESGEGYLVYAYVNGDGTMYMLEPDETTAPLTALLTMSNVSNAAYAGVEDINASVDSYVISTADTPTVPTEAWAACKNAGATA